MRRQMPFRDKSVAAAVVRSQYGVRSTEYGVSSVPYRVPRTSYCVRPRIPRTLRTFRPNDSFLLFGTAKPSLIVYKGG
jgi:hypothetical protein